VIRREQALLLLLVLGLAAGCSTSSDRTDRGGESPPASAGSDGRALLRREQALMGTFFKVQAVTDDEPQGEEAIDAALAEVARLEDLLSEWRETSEISAVNRAAGRGPVEVGPELYAVVERSIRASELTGGAFDATFGGCGHLWDFRRERPPDEDRIASCLSVVGYRRLQLDPQRSSIHLPRSGMRIGIAGIGKGYAVDRAAEVLLAHGVDDFLVDGGGDIRLAGGNLDRPWNVGIAHPRRPGELLARLSLDGGAIVTSGDYQRYFERDGVRYHHILDPTTGRPARRSVAATVIAANATDADALATGLFVMGPERGLALVETLPDVEALMIDSDQRLRTSSGFPPYEDLREP
jgi:thiamine biosynthesis lipoprotein